MRMLIVWSAFLFLRYYGVHSLADHPIGTRVNVTMSDKNLTTLPMLLSVEKNLKVEENNRATIPKRVVRDLNQMETISATDSSVLSDNTLDNGQTPNQDDKFTLAQNRMLATSGNSRNVINDDAQKFSNNTPETHGTIVSPRMDLNASHYTNKFSNVMHVKAHPNQLVNDTTGNDELLENSAEPHNSISAKKRHVDQMVPDVQGQTVNGNCPILRSADVKHAVYMKSLSLTNNDGSVENLICTKASLLPDHFTGSIVRKMDRAIKTVLARINVNPSGGKDHNEDEEKGQDHDDEDEDDDDDDDEDDGECGCGCGCGCRKTTCCGCQKNKSKKCPTGVTVSSGSGRRSGATYPLNFNLSETTVDSTTPIETTDFPTTTVFTTIPTTTPSSTITTTTSLPTTTSTTPLTTTPTTPATTTTSITPATTTTSTTPAMTTISTTPSTTTTSTTPSTTTISTTPSTTTTSTTPSTTTTSTTPLTTTNPTTPWTTTTEFITTTISTTTVSPLTAITPPALNSPLRRTSTNLEPEKKRNGKRKKCTKKKRRKEGLLASESVDANLMADKDKVVNVTEPTRVPFSGLLDTQVE